MKKLMKSLILTIAISIASAAMPAYAEATLPEYDSHILSEAELDTFFAIESMNKVEWGDRTLNEAVSKLYSNLKADGNADVICGMNYSAVESIDEAKAAEYADYFADFELSSVQNVSALLVGNYGSFGTIPVGIVNIKAGEPVRVMDTAAVIMNSSGMKITYKDVVGSVRSFNCAAIPLTSEVIKAFYPIMCELDPSGFAVGYPEYNSDAEEVIMSYLHSNANILADPEPFVLVENSAGLNLGLNLYETAKDENGKLVETGTTYEVTTNFFVPYESTVLDTAAKDAFFGDEYKYGGEIVKDIYNELKNAENDIVYAMNFKAVETYDEAVASPYAWYITDFELTADKDASVLLVGNYGKYKTIPIGIVNLTAGQPTRIMKTASTYGAETGNKDVAGWTFNYKEIVELVKDFDCAAIPVSKEFLKAYYTVKTTDSDYLAANPAYNADVEAALLAELAASETVNPLGADSFKIAEDETNFSLELKLYENDNSTPNKGATKYDETGKSWLVGNTNTFTYYAPEEEVVQPEIMQKSLVIFNMDKKVQDGKTFYPLHVYSGIDSLKYQRVGFKVNVTNTDTNKTAEQDVHTTTVYSGMTVTNSNGSKEHYDAGKLDGTYMFGREILFTVGNWTNANTKVEVTPYAIDLNDKEITGKTVTLTDEIIKSRYPSSALFKEVQE